MVYFNRRGSEMPERLPRENVPIDRDPEYQPPIEPPALPPPTLPRTPTPLPRAPVPPAGGGGFHGGPRRSRRMEGPTGLGGGTFASPMLPRSMVPFRTTEFSQEGAANPAGLGWLGGRPQPEPEDDDVRRYLQSGGRVVL